MRFSTSKLTLVSIAFFLIALLGCNVQEATPSIAVPEGVNLELVKEVESISEKQIQKIVFTEMLSKEEKVFIFKKRITEQMQQLSLSSEQKDHLELLVANMTPEMYVNSPLGRKRVDFLSNWTAKGKALFGEEALRNIVASLTPLEAGKKQVAPLKTSPSTGTNCNCATSSSYCGDGYGCTYIPSCNIQGCGTLFVYTCNGSCDRII